MLQYLVGGVVIVFLVLLILGAVTGRVKSRSCCSVADPRQDLRMRGAFDDEASPQSPTS